MKKYSSFKQVLAGLKRLRGKGWEARRDRFDYLRLRQPGGRYFCFCPWTALYFNDTEDIVKAGDANFEKAIKCGFRKEVAQKVIDLADNEPITGDWAGPVSEETFNAAQNTLRGVCGILEKPTERSEL